jgi:hypothetical protein
MALFRLENLARRDMPIEEMRPVIGDGLGLVVHLSKDYEPERGRYRRYMREIMAVDGYKDGEYVLRSLKKWEREGGGWSPLLQGIERWS